MKWQFYEFEKSLACFDDWKIILTNNSDKEVKQQLEKELGIELSDANNYFCPSEKSKLRTIQRIVKNPGDDFDFGQWITKYIKDTKSLILQDGYACAKNEFRDLEHIIAALPNKSIIKIITLSDEARNNSRKNNSDDGIICEKKLLELKRKFSDITIEWEFKKIKNLLEDRHIETDKFNINLGHSLGSTYKDRESGKILCRKQFTITVSKKS